MKHSKLPLLLVIFVLVGCMGIACKKRNAVLDTSVGTVKPVPFETDEKGWPIYRVTEEGFALAIPSDWRHVDMNKEKFEASIQEMVRQKPQMEPMVGSLRQQGNAGFKFFGFDVANIKAGFATNVNVLRLQLPIPMTLDQRIAANLRELERNEL